MSKGKGGRRKAPVRPPRRLPDGYFSVHRRILTEDMRGDGPMILIWVTLIGWANFADGKEKVGGRQVPLKRGQCITGVDELAEEFGLSRSTVRRCLLYLEETGRIGRETGIRGSIITLHNYDSYQATKKESDPNQDADRTLTGRSQDADRQLDKYVTKKQRGQRELFTDDTSPEEIPRIPRATKSEAAAAAKVSKSGPTWEAYRMAVRLLHSTAEVAYDPPSNAQVRSLACKLVDLVGADDAPAVAEYYVLNERTAWIVQARHPFPELVKNYGKYYANWKTGEKIGVGTARALERDDANQSAFQKFRENKNRNIAGS